MIQRLQTVYLLFASFLSGLLLKGSILKFIDKSGSGYFINFSGILKSGENGVQLIDKLLPLSVLLVIIPLILIFALFLYKHRKLQLRITLTGIISTGVLIALTTFYSFNVMQKFNAKIIPGIKMIIPLLTFIFSILAYHNIRKDEKLVSSYDRLR